MRYRTRTYIAADWDNDKEVVDKLRKWNNSDKYSLDFSDAHDLTQARDTSLYCSIKKSLIERLKGSKTFVLIVGDHTKNLTKGKCCYCEHYNKYTEKCSHNNQIDMRSYIEFECELALYYKMKIIVIYKSNDLGYINKCPDVLRPKSMEDMKYHIPASYSRGNKTYWNYEAIKNALED